MIIYNYYFAKINDWRSIPVYEKRLYLSICRISMTADSMIFKSSGGVCVGVRARNVTKKRHVTTNRQNSMQQVISAIDIHLEMIYKIL